MQQRLCIYSNAPTQCTSKALIVLANATPHGSPRIAGCTEKVAILLPPMCNMYWEQGPV